MGYDSNCSHKPRGTSKPNFSHQRVIFPQSRQSAIYRIVTHNFTNDNLTNGKSPSYQSLVNIPPALLCSPLRLVTEETPVPATWTLSSVPVLPAKPALFLFFYIKNRALPARKFSISSIPIKSRCPSQNLPISHLPRRIIPRERAHQVSHLMESASRQWVIIFPRGSCK